jgi:hypothetical protein
MPSFHCVKLKSHDGGRRFTTHRLYAGTVFLSLCVYPSSVRRTGAFSGARDCRSGLERIQTDGNAFNANRYRVGISYIDRSLPDTHYVWWINGLLSPVSCQRACLSFPACSIWTYDSTGYCELYTKERQSHERISPGAVSGVIDGASMLGVG